MTFWLIEVVVTVNDLAALAFGKVAANVVRLVGAGMMAADLAGLTVPCTATDWVATPRLCTVTLPDLLPTVLADNRA